MSSLLSGLQSALQTMLAQQAAINVTQHNVANANTPGYHRQEVHLSSNPAYPSASIYYTAQAGQIGTGVNADIVKRFSLTFFDGRYRSQAALNGQWESAHTDLSQIEAVLGETTDNSLVTELDAFWDGWQALGSDPTNLTIRNDLYQRAGSLAAGINQRAESLIELRKDLDLWIDSDVRQINEIAARLASLNVEITNVSAMDLQPNDQLDERDRLLDELAGITDIKIGLQDSGEVMVSIGGHALVVGKETYSLETSPDPGNDNLSSILWEDGSAFVPAEGSLSAHLDVRDRVIPAQQTGLDQLAGSLIAEVNAIHQGGYGLDNSTSLDFFAGTDALSMTLSTDISDPRSIASAGAIDSPGDSSVAQLIANLRHQSLMSGGTQTMTTFYADQIAGLGLEIQEAESQMANSNLILDSLGTQRESVSGVSLDEEAANLIQSQRAFEAAARLTTALDEMLDKIINGMGLVGR